MLVASRLMYGAGCFVGIRDRAAHFTRWQIGTWKPTVNCDGSASSMAKFLTAKNVI